MDKKRQRKIGIYAGLVGGVLIDGYLRLISGDEGNLLVHTVVFLGSAALVMLMVKGFFYLQERRKQS